MLYTLATTSEEEDERPRVTAAAPTPAMNSERAAKPLHNFSLPWDLKWGSQRHLRCMKVDDADALPAAARLDRRRSESGTARRREIEGGFERRMRPARRPRIDDGGGEAVDMEVEEEGIEAVREKLMFEFKTAADKMKDAIFRCEEDAVLAPAPAPVRLSPADADVEEEDDEEEEGEIVAVAAGEEGGGGSPAAAVRPWNLRTRRAACKAPPIKGLRIEERKVNSSSPLRSESGAKSPKLVWASGSGVEKERPKERAKFSVTLSKKEIDEDFMKMLGHRAPRRPKKRPRAVQKLLEDVFPGTWLTEVSPASYKVPEFPETGKR